MIFHKKLVKNNETYVSFSRLAEIPAEMSDASRSTRVGWLLAAISRSTSFAARPGHHVENTAILLENLKDEISFLSDADVKDLLSASDLTSRMNYLLDSNRGFFNFERETQKQIGEQMGIGFFKYLAFSDSLAVFQS